MLFGTEHQIWAGLATKRSAYSVIFALWLHICSVLPFAELTAYSRRHYWISHSGSNATQWHVGIANQHDAELACQLAQYVHLKQSLYV